MIPPFPVFDAVRRGGTRAPGSWICVVSVNEPTEALIADMLSEADSQFHQPIESLDVRGIEPFQLAKDLQRHDADWLLLHGFDSWSPNDWHAAELNRNAWLRRAGLTWFLFGPAGASNLAKYAPNVRSLLGPFLVVDLDGAQMTEAERQGRLAQLRERYGITDEGVIAGVESGSLEMTPHMVEWLILLDRGDLV